LYRGLGDTSFAKVSTGAPVTNIGNSNSSSWVDLDDDGNLDLYVVNFQGNDFLYHNDGPPSYTFTRVDTTAMTTGTEFSIPGAWADYNGDGLEDLFIGNAGTQNDYLCTNHAHLWFTRQTFSDGRSTLGASWGDYDNDGWLDLVVTHYSGQPNTLYHNSGPPLFTLTPVTTSIVSSEVGSWVGSAWGDFDNDGNLDLYVANDGAPGALYHNGGPPDYGFTRITTGAVATDVDNAFGAVWGDYDRDGQLDLFVADHAGNRNRLYHNDGNGNHWLTVRCRGTISNRTAIGAKVRVLATIAGTPVWQLREVTGQTGYNSQNLDQHFGLGDAPVVDSLRVEWPSGRRDTWAAVPADRLLILDEGTGTVGVGNPGAGVASALTLEPARPNPCRGAAILSFTLPRDGRALIEVFDIRGRRVSRVLDTWLPMGRHEAPFSASARSPEGVYFCCLTSGGETRTTRFVLTR
ncbi:MAG: FG-GAP-like repeat-containing protein, partial [Candidatus Eisenbacteria bacterium]